MRATGPASLLEFARPFASETVAAGPEANSADPWKPWATRQPDDPARPAAGPEPAARRMAARRLPAPKKAREVIVPLTLDPADLENGVVIRLALQMAAASEEVDGENDLEAAA